jgi:hypothetical protein
MVAYATVSIWDLPFNATMDDVRRFFEEQDPESDPVISPLVLGPMTNTQNHQGHIQVLKRNGRSGYYHSSGEQ